MDKTTNLPYQIDTFTISDVSKTSNEAQLEFKLSHRHPLDPITFGQNDLSPSSYSDYVEKLRDFESDATLYKVYSEIRKFDEN